MNKYAIIGILAVIVVGGGIFYRAFLLPEGSAPVVTGNIIPITVIAKKDQWRFEPETINATRGDHIVMTVVNEDEYDHGLAIDAFGISQRMPANETITIEFDVTQAGEFPLYCSVPCGEGVVDGKLRTHFDMIGTLRVQNIVSQTQ
ncbi:MAG: cupredoxin domain-containing protein [Patescibacteria group bacterium]|mgnify:FL=1